MTHQEFIKHYQWLREQKEGYGLGPSDFQVALAVFDSIKAQLEIGDSVLDCSCGRGSILRMCQRLYAAEGTEANQELIDRDLQGLHVLKLFYADLPKLRPQKWDAVVSSDVLEHMFTEDEVRRAIRDLAALARKCLICCMGITPSIWNIAGRPVALHHVVRDPGWWEDEIGAVGKIVTSRPARKDAYLIVAEVDNERRSE